ncbi:hypothetical protein RRG08_023032 [Elysia crispata]|uniref:Uncharacterized protein n=1 Tax=Elysia crispata TaxID=231223 RepID=A0AAE1D1L1_9GAST|nr:hypothetical protein RRG08_023032 [Elysia crispata]
MGSTTTVPELPVRTVASVASLKLIPTLTNIGSLQTEDSDISLICCFVKGRSQPSVLERRQLSAFGHGLLRHFPRLQIKDSPLCIIIHRPIGEVYKNILPPSLHKQAMELSHEA